MLRARAGGIRAKDRKRIGQDRRRYCADVVEKARVRAWDRCAIDRHRKKIVSEDPLFARDRSLSLSLSFPREIRAHHTRHRSNRAGGRIERNNGREREETARGRASKERRRRRCRRPDTREGGKEEEGGARCFALRVPKDACDEAEDSQFIIDRFGGRVAPIEWMGRSKGGQKYTGGAPIEPSPSHHRVQGREAATVVCALRSSFPLVLPLSFLSPRATRACVVQTTASKGGLPRAKAAGCKLSAREARGRRQDAKRRKRDKGSTAAARPRRPGGKEHYKQGHARARKVQRGMPEERTTVG